MRPFCPHLAKLALGTAATVAVLEGASPAQLEAALFCGLLPEFISGGRGLPFWLQAEAAAHVQAEHPLPSSWRAISKQPRLEWRTIAGLSDDPAAVLSALDAAVAQADAGRALVVLSTWALADGRVAPRHAAPLDRPVLLIRGFEQPKTCVGILEVAGILRRALTGEVLTDAL
ncbi:MAG: hypothetical protein M5U25_13860 [Planctomycetota bacterium]|nr:hypothetical protein [Planctomycetota bacterium]